MLLTVVATLALGHSQVDPNVVTWRTYKTGAYSKAEDQRILEISTLAEFQQYVNNYGPEGAGDGRDVAWGKEELVAIHIGPRKTSGYSVAVDTIKKTKPTESCVFWAELTPTKDVRVERKGTSPWRIVRLNRTGTHLVFEGSRREDTLPGGIQILDFPGYGHACTCCPECIRESQERLPWRPYEGGRTASVLLASTCVMNSEADYQNYLRNFGVQAANDGSDVDWYRERLVAIHLGRKMSAGYRVVVTGVRIVDGNRVDVRYDEVQPTGLALNGGGSTGPYVVIRIPRWGNLVTFTKQMVRDCDPIEPERCGCGCGNCSCGRN